MQSDNNKLILSLNHLESLLIESCQAGTFISNLQGNLIECNTSFAKMFGFENKNEILAVNTVNFYSSASERENYLSILHKEGKVRAYKATAIRRDGIKIIHSINSDFFKTEDGSTLILGSTIDITQIENFGNQLNESKKKYQDLIENSLEIIQSFDPQGKLLFCNQAWHNTLEYSPDEAKKLNLFDIIAASDQEHCKELFKVVIQGKSLKNIEVTFLSKSGKKYLLEGNIVPLEENGKLKATHAFFRDVTDKKQAVQKIIDQEKLLQTIFNTVPICLYLKSADGKYLHTNEIMEKTLGFSITGKYDTELFPNTTCHLLKSTDSEAVSKPNEIIRFELQGEFIGQERTFYAGKKAIFNETTNEYDIFGFSLDISDFKNSLKKIEENEKILQFIVNNSPSGFLLFRQNAKENNFDLEFANAFANELLNLNFEQKQFSVIFKFLEDKINFPEFLQNENHQEIIDWEKHEGKNIPSRNFSIRMSLMNEPNSIKRLIVFIIDVTEQQN